MTLTTARALTFVALLATSTAALQAMAQPAASSFDGTWTVRILCPSNTEDSAAKGYSFEFPATVRDGYLLGSYGQAESAGSLRIEGPIGPDGEATLRARGRTSNPDYAVQKPSSGTPYSYTIKARFERSSGTGSRQEARICNFTFKR